MHGKGIVGELLGKIWRGGKVDMACFYKEERERAETGSQRWQKSRPWGQCIQTLLGGGGVSSENFLWTGSGPGTNG